MGTPVTATNKTIIMEYSGPWIVKLEYFKTSGKYYSDGEYSSKKLALYEIFIEVREMLLQGKRPGLVDCIPGANEFHCYVQVSEHPHNHPCLILASNGHTE